MAEKGYEILNFPTSVGIQTIDYCAHSCTPCPMKSERIAGRITGKLMEWSLFDKIIDELSVHESNLKRVNLYALNDPLEDSRIVNLVKSARAKLPKINIGLSTSGIFNFTPQLYLELKDAGLSTLFISVPSLTREGYKRIMQKDTLDVVLSKIDDCLAKEKGESIIRVGAPVTNEFNLNAFIRYFEAKRNIPIDVWLVENRAGLNVNFQYHAPKDISPALIEHGLKWKRCDRPLDMANIMYDGRIILCCADWKKEVILGDLSKQTLEKIWCSDTARNIQHKISEGKYYRIPLCARCIKQQKNSQIKYISNQ